MGAITGYEVLVYSGGGEPTVMPVSGSGSGTSTTLTGLTQGGTYAFVIRAVNAYATSATSPWVGAITLP